MSESEYQNLLQQRGLHGLVLAMSTEPFIQATERDWNLRAMILAFATAAVFALGLAWRNVAATNELEMRLLRASEMNTHLQELSVAAAGLAHETRNPLNIISGLAQMITKQQDATTEVRKKAKEIIAETDRVTVQLNEFINYSRPREVRPAIVQLGEVVGEVSRALQFDLEEKMLRLRIQEKLPAIEADEHCYASRSSIYCSMPFRRRIVAAKSKLPGIARMGAAPFWKFATTVPECRRNNVRKSLNPISPHTKRELDSAWPWCNKSSLLMAGKLHVSPTNRAARSFASRTSNSLRLNQFRGNRREDILIVLKQNFASCFFS
jgi:hypothetical protein